MGLVKISEDKRKNRTGGVTRQDLLKIPIHVVGVETLNNNRRSNMQHSSGSNPAVTRGLCLSETKGRHGVSSRIEVTAILCIVGLPSDLTTSILAHGE